MNCLNTQAAVLLVMILYRDVASRVALVMAPLLPRIRRGVGNMGLKTGGGGGFTGGERENQLLFLHYSRKRTKSIDSLITKH